MPTVAFVAFFGGALAAATICFLRWRFRKQVVPSSYWMRLMDDFRSMEETVNTTASTEQQVRLAYEELSGRLISVTTDNEQLHDQLQSLQTDLAVVTNEATLLVNGLRDNEERWASAEDLRTELEFTMSQLHEAKQLLEEKLSRQENELGSAKLTIAKLRMTADRNAALEAQLVDAAERDRGHAAVLTRLERLYDQTSDQLRAATRQAETAQWQLRDRPAAGLHAGVRSTGAFEDEISDPAIEGEAESIIDLDEVDAAPPTAETPERRVFDRSRSLHNRLQRSYGRLPASD